MEPFEEIKKTIHAAIDDVEVQILDPRSDGVHLEAIVISPTFESMSLVDRHRLVMNALKIHFNNGLHAMGLKTLTPQEAAGER